MDLTKKNILLTGPPGVGKTTLMKKLAEKLRQFHPVGFYTEEIRKEGVRKGFALISLDGGKGLLSHTDIKSPYRVGKYRVDIRKFEDFLDSIPFFDHEAKLIVLDEIGKMECLSYKFRKILKDILNSEKTVIATIALKGDRFTGEVKERPDVRMFEITESNRDSVLLEVLNEAVSV